MIVKVEKKLSLKAINKAKNQFAKEGYKECLRLLNDRLKNPENPYFLPDTEEEVEKMCDVYTEQLKTVRKLKTVRGRGIAILCVDWLNGVNVDFLNIKL